MRGQSTHAQWKSEVRPRETGRAAGSAQDGAAQPRGCAAGRGCRSAAGAAAPGSSQTQLRLPAPAHPHKPVPACPPLAPQAEMALRQQYD